MFIHFHFLNKLLHFLVKKLHLLEKLLHFLEKLLHFLEKQLHCSAVFPVDTSHYFAVTFWLLMFQMRPRPLAASLTDGSHLSRVAHAATLTR